MFIILFFAVSDIYSMLCAFLFLYFMAYRFLQTQLARAARDFQARPINSANPAINEIINKNPNEPKSAVIEAFLCGRCRAIVLVMHALISVFRIACQLTMTEIWLLLKAIGTNSQHSLIILQKFYD